MAQNTLSVYSPVKGKIVPIEEVVDPIFSGKCMGDGLAVAPAEGVVYAPFDGVIKSVNQAKHAIGIEAEGVEVLIHVGVDTVSLNGKGFDVYVKPGVEVKKGDKLLKFDKDFVAKKVPSTDVVMIVLSPEGAVVNKTAPREVNVGDALFSVGESGAPAAEDSADDEDICGEIVTSEEIEILNPHGLHARPASVIANIAGKTKCKVQLIKGTDEARARNLLEIMSLNIAKGDKVKVSGVRRIVEEIVDAIKNGLNEVVVQAAQVAKDVNVDKTENLNMDKEQRLSVNTLAKGKLIGRTFLYERDSVHIEESSTDADKERHTLADAVEKTKKELEEIIATTKNTSEKEILNAHITILNDSSIFEKVDELLNEKKSAPYALKTVIEESIILLKKTNNPLLIERISDFMDVKDRLITAMLGPKPEKPVPAGAVVLAKDLLPSDVKILEKNSVAGVVLAEGSSTSHVAIMLKNAGIPSVYGAGRGVLKVKNGAYVIINTKEGVVIVNPSSGLKKDFEKQIAEEKALLEKYRKEMSLSAVTKDGVEVKITGNIGGAEQAAKALLHGADGVGLLRTEFMFDDRKTPPTEEEQIALYQEVLDAMDGRPVTIRTLDTGGDKPISYINIPAEENPVLGIRGMRAYVENEDIIRTQFRALLQVKPLNLLKIMIPMITFEEDFAYAKKLFLEEKAALGVNAPVAFGMMIETPAAALTTQAFCAESDFFSFGTNDLSQYALAIDRGHARLSKRVDALHPAVLRLIQIAAQDAKAFGRPVSVCGALASEPQALPLLVGAGINELAVTTAQIPEIKYMIRQLDSAKCEDALMTALTLRSVEEVKELIKKEFGI